MTKQAEAQRDLEVKRAQYQELVQKQKAQADKAYEIQASVMQQQVVAEQVRVQQVERNEQVKVQEAEISRRKNELIATELEVANVQAQRRQVLADGEKKGLELEASGRAEAIRQEGQAEAEIIRMKGEAEAKAMERKAEAYRLYGQAAVLDKLLSGLPDVVRAIAEPLGRVDRITVVSTGDGDGANASAGVSKVTADIAKMVAQVPTLVESLSGISVAELLKSLPQLGPAIRAAEMAGKGVKVPGIAGAAASDPEIEMLPDDGATPRPG